MQHWGRQRYHCWVSTCTGVLTLWMLLFGWSTPSKAEDNVDPASQWGGYIRAIGTLSYPDDQSIYQFTDTDTFYDRQAELRLKHQLFLMSQLAFETHYELVALRGDTLKNNHRLRATLPAATANRLVGNDAINDDHRLMNLTRTLQEGEDHLIYHRLDRLNLTYTTDRGTLRMGRQALTWGNGMLFNPMDLFNPFAPTAIQRDYKLGEDMLHLQRPLADGEAQLLYLPRRDTTSGEIENDQSSLAGKWHFPLRAMEVDLMAAQHYNDVILAAGASGYLGGAAWRSDLVYTILDDEETANDFWQLVANMDYAWQWGGKNIYGLIEFYYNSLGKSKDYTRALEDPSISERISRGELFTLGNTYLAGQIQVELHPLVQTHLITIINLTDPSLIFQPQLAWDVGTNFQIILGAGFNWGHDGSEFGGFDTTVGGSTIKVTPTDSRYLWLTYYF